VKIDGIVCSRRQKDEKKGFEEQMQRVKRLQKWG